MSLCSHFQIYLLPCVYLAHRLPSQRPKRHPHSCLRPSPHGCPRSPTDCCNCLPSPLHHQHFLTTYMIPIPDLKKKNFSTFFSTTSPLPPHPQSPEFIPSRFSPLPSADSNLVKVTTDLHMVTSRGCFSVILLLGLPTGFAKVGPRPPS